MITYRKIFTVWWPLALSWLLMGIELPMLTSVVARLPDPEINLAAYGEIVFPLALILEAPVLMLLSASTALSQDLSVPQVTPVYHFDRGSYDGAAYSGGLHPPL